VFGDGQFITGGGRPSFHEKALKFFLRRPGHKGRRVQDKLRVSSLRRCCEKGDAQGHLPDLPCADVQYRDSAGAHNIAGIGIGMAQILGNPRPLALQRPTQAAAETTPCFRR
ncbi:hypothetical protein BGX28_010352, partial [Mortierella sp. GBA30]